MLSKASSLRSTFVILATWAICSMPSSAETVFVKYRGDVDLKPFACTLTPRSSFIQRLCYDEKNSYVIVNLAGTYYHYCDVPKPLVNEWLKADSSHDGDNQLMYKELVALIRKLSPAYRVVFNLHVIDGYSHQEIARILGISAGTSKSNLFKAKAFLQKFLVKDQKGNILCFT